LESLVKRLDLSEDVALPGFVANPYPYMRRASVFVLSSAWEGLPTVLIEALALGASIVSTDCPSGPSEILDNGRYGALVPVGDAEAMAQAMHKAITAKPIQRDPASWARFTVSAATAAYIETLLPSSSPRPSPKNAHGEYRSTIWN
jgi:glycosyltransferase involved in cell wall biosynthesis